MGHGRRTPATDDEADPGGQHGESHEQLDQRLVLLRIDDVGEVVIDEAGAGQVGLAGSVPAPVLDMGQRARPADEHVEEPVERCRDVNPDGAGPAPRDEPAHDEVGQEREVRHHGGVGDQSVPHESFQPDAPQHGRAPTRLTRFTHGMRVSMVDDRRMTVDVQVETVIDRPVAEVASYAGDPSNAPEWYSNITSVSWQTPPPVAVGSQMDFVAQFLGRTLAYTYEVVELEPNERLVMRTADGPFPMETTYEWTAVDETRTRLTLRNRGEPAGFARLTAPMMERAMRRATTKDLERLKRLLETR